MVFAAIVAGGSGQRAKQPIPKQFVHIGEKPVIIHTIEKFIPFSDIVYVACPKDMLEYSKKLLSSYIKSQKIKIVAGGSTRMESMLCILSSIKANFKTSETDVIVTHDAIRPFVSDEIIKNNIETAQKHGACGTYTFSADTVALSNDGKTVESVPPRDTVLHAQTPQSFNFSLLCDIFSKCRDTVESFTDLCSMATDVGEEVRIVEGTDENFKITTPFDMKMASLLATKTTQPED